MAIIWVVAMIVVQVGVARVARHRAESAADLSALAAAARAFAAPAEACSHAGTIAAANGARIDSCSMSGGIADVAVSVRFLLPLLGSRTATAIARAGPVGARA